MYGGILEPLGEKSRIMDYSKMNKGKAKLFSLATNWVSFEYDTSILLHGK